MGTAVQKERLGERNLIEVTAAMARVLELSFYGPGTAGVVFRLGGGCSDRLTLRQFGVSINYFGMIIIVFFQPFYSQPTSGP